MQCIAYSFTVYFVLLYSVLYTCKHCIVYWYTLYCILIYSVLHTCIQCIIYLYTMYCIVLSHRYTYWTLSYALTRRGMTKLLSQDPIAHMLPVDEYLPIMFDSHDK